MYREDIGKHAKGYESKVESIFDEIPGQLSKHEKKFVLKSLEKGAKKWDAVLTGTKTEDEAWAEISQHKREERTESETKSIVFCFFILQYVWNRNLNFKTQSKRPASWAFDFWVNICTTYHKMYKYINVIYK